MCSCIYTVVLNCVVVYALRQLAHSRNYIFLHKLSQCMNKPSLEVVHRLVELYPKAVEEHDKIGRLPLHLACAHQASFEVVEYLIERYPEGVIELSDRGVSISCVVVLLNF